MKKRLFKFPMKQGEAIFGWLYLFLHIFVVGNLVIFANAYLFPRIGFQLTSAQANLLYYAIGFFLILIFMFHYLKESFSYLWDHKMDVLTSIVLGYIFYMLAGYVISLLLTLILHNAINPNSAAVITEVKLNKNVMLVVSVLFAPIVEETLFRGTVFGTIRKKNRIVAYIVSTLLFSVYHLWEYLLGGFDWSIILYMLQYVPASIVLAWCYERGHSIWTPIFLHMLINYISVTVTVG